LSHRCICVTLLSKFYPYKNMMIRSSARLMKLVSFTSEIYVFPIVSRVAFSQATLLRCRQILYIQKLHKSLPTPHSSWYSPKTFHSIHRLSTPLAMQPGLAVSRPKHAWKRKLMVQDRLWYHTDCVFGAVHSHVPAWPCIWPADLQL
jgi:hypothetical protein